MRPVVYYCARKNRHHSDALVAGFGAVAVPVERRRPVPGDDVLHIIGGLQFGSLDILHAVRAAGRPYVFVDRAYFGGGPGSNVLRVVPKAYQQHWIACRYADRWDALRIPLQPWRRSGRHILVVPPGEAIRDLFGLGDWTAETVEQLRQVTDRPIDVSIKGDPRPLSTRLHDCHCVVTWSSNVAVEAVVAGVPVFAGRWSAAVLMGYGLHELPAMIEAPRMPYRVEWARSLAYGQFTLAEIADGTAYRTIAPRLQLQ